MGGRLREEGRDLTRTTNLLPDEFAELEPFAAEWSLAAEGDRFAKRLATSMSELRALYDAVTPRAEEAIAYCDRFSLDDMPPTALNLLYLLYSAVTISFAIECWSQPRVPDSGAAVLDCLVQPGP